MAFLTARRIATFVFLVAVFLGWLILGEPIGPRTLVASIIIVAAVAIITTQKSKTQKKQAR